MSEAISREEHEEFARRMEDENKRQNHRLEILEHNMEDLHDLTVSVGKMANHMENIDREQERQGKRLETLEGRDGEKWRKIIYCVITGVVTAVLGFLLGHVGL